MSGYFHGHEPCVTDLIRLSQETRPHERLSSWARALYQTARAAIFVGTSPYLTARAAIFVGTSPYQSARAAIFVGTSPYQTARAAIFVGTSPYQTARAAIFVGTSPYQTARAAIFVGTSPYQTARAAFFVGANPAVTGLLLVRLSQETKLRTRVTIAHNGPDPPRSLTMGTIGSDRRVGLALACQPGWVWPIVYQPLPCRSAGYL